MAGRQETQASSGTRGRGGGGGDWGRGRGDGWRGRDRGRSGAPRPPPPDHFVSLRVPSELAAPYFDAAHAALRLHSEGALEPFLVGSETAHVTLAVVRLNGEESKGESGDGKDDENKTADASPATKWDGSKPQSDPARVEAATRALAAAAKTISEAALEGGEEGGEERNETATTSVASALLSNLSLLPELGTFGGSSGGKGGSYSSGKVLWLKPDDGLGGRALAAAERAVSAALAAEAAVLVGPSSAATPAPAPAAKQLFTPHVTVAKVRWVPPPSRGWRRGGGAPPPPPSSIPDEAHRGAFAGLQKSALFGAPELELCRIGSSRPGRYYEVVATAKIAVG